MNQAPLDVFVPVNPWYFTLKHITPKIFNWHCMMQLMIKRLPR